MTLSLRVLFFIHDIHMTLLQEYVQHARHTLSLSHCLIKLTLDFMEENEAMELGVEDKNN